MRSMLKLLFLSILVASLAYGFNSDRLNQRVAVSRRNHGRVGIYGGNNSTIKKHPYLGSLVWSGTGLLDGTVAIVSNQWVLTTVQAVMSVDPFEIDICAGCADGLTGDDHFVSYILLHPKYDFTKPNDYNYALIKLYEKFKWSKKVQPLKLPRASPKANTVMSVSGWGYTGPEWDYTWRLKDGSLTWLSTSKCQKVVSSYGVQWTKRIGCAYNENTTLCDIDYGDPLVNKGVLYGLWLYVQNNGTVCGADSPPLVVVDVHAVAGWIKRVTGAKYEDEE